MITMYTLYDLQFLLLHLNHDIIQKLFYCKGYAEQAALFPCFLFLSSKRAPLLHLTAAAPHYTSQLKASGLLSHVHTE